jgi:glycopeptide antibiotics resistance protein
MRGINLIPFHYDQIAESRFHFNEVLYNTIVFIPAGFYFTVMGKKKFLSGIVLSALLSLSFETLQWIFALGASDITDLIMNTVGGAIGAGTYWVSEKLFKGNEVKIISIIGAILETLLVGLLLVLMISNL